MGWPLRMFVPEEIYFVTVRCFQRRLLMRPSPETMEVLGGVLARAARLNGIAHVEISDGIGRYIKTLRPNLDNRKGDSRQPEEEPQSRVVTRHRLRFRNHNTRSGFNIWLGC